MKNITLIIAFLVSTVSFVYSQKTIEKKIDVNNQRLNNACLKFGCRKRCCFNFLPRSHKVNRFFGRLFRRPENALAVEDLLFSE